MNEEEWIKHMDIAVGKEWIPQLREVLSKEEHNALLFIPILFKAVINLEKRVYELEMQERIRNGKI